MENSLLSSSTHASAHAHAHVACVRLKRGENSLREGEGMVCWEMGFCGEMLCTAMEWNGMETARGGDGCGKEKNE